MMGCDIHFNIEVKTKNGWELYSKTDVKRNYLFFAKLAGVRNDYNVVPLCEPRGIPDDASFLVRKSYEEMGGYQHHAGFITAKEINQLQDWLRRFRPLGPTDLENDLEHVILGVYLEGNSFAIRDDLEGVPDWITDVRFIFWFDN